MEIRVDDIPAGSGTLGLRSIGDPEQPAVVLLHGWPQDGSGWDPVLQASGGTRHLIAPDLPGIGRSVSCATSGSKREIATVLREALRANGIRVDAVIGTDIGGMVAFAWARHYEGLAKVGICDVVIPGIDPWNTVLANPYIWHFAFHAIPDLPETLVAGRERPYLDYFFSVLSADPARITEERRAHFAQVYSDPLTFRNGLDDYRAFPQDTNDNGEVDSASWTFPGDLLYLRGDAEGGRMDDYVAGLTAAGFPRIRPVLIPDAGHYVADEQPDAFWQAIDAFMEGDGARSPGPLDRPVHSSGER